MTLDWYEFLPCETVFGFCELLWTVSYRFYIQNCRKTNTATQLFEPHHSRKERLITIIKKTEVRATPNFYLHNTRIIPVLTSQNWQTRKKSEIPSCLRRQASRTIWKHWIPAFAGMTSKDVLRLFTNHQNYFADDFWNWNRLDFFSGHPLDSAFDRVVNFGKLGDSHHA